MPNKNASSASKKKQEPKVTAVNKDAKSQALYAARKKIFPRKVKGNFRRFKWIMLIFTLGIYYITPWLRWDRGEFAPNQFLLLNIEHRRFYFAFIEIWPQEFYYVAGMLIMAGIGLFLTTSAVGRAWCGYACPQTVWTDLFMLVDRIAEGDRNARIKLDKAPMSFSKFTKRATKHVLWILISIITAITFTLYFANAPDFIIDLFTFKAPNVAYATIGVLTFTTYTFAGIMREQLCIYMCPWPRIQGAMLDEHSLTVTYNDWRGESRTKHSKKEKALGNAIGDCIDCDACVAVCPTGIDIRDGQQLECITCGLCIDACNDVMDKIGSDRGLISYTTFNYYNENMDIATAGAYSHAGTPSEQVIKAIDPTKVRDKKSGKIKPEFKHTNWREITRPRTLLYLSVWAAIGIAMLLTLSFRSPLDLNVLRDRNPRFVMLSDGSIRNGYDVKILNMTPIYREVELSIEGLPTALMSLGGSGAKATSTLNLTLEPDRVLPIRLYIKVDPEQLNAGRSDFVLNVRNIEKDETASADVIFETPED